MKQAKMRQSLHSIQLLLNDTTTDDLTKWRNFCFSQLTKLEYNKFFQKQEISKLEQESQRLGTIINDISINEKEIESKKQELLEAISNAKKESNFIREKIAYACNKKGNSFDIQNAPVFFETRLQVHQAKMRDEILPKFNAAFSKIDKTLSKISQIKLKFQKLNKIIFQNKLKYEQYTEESQSVQQLIDGLKIPNYSPEVKAISSKFQNIEEASTTLLALENKIRALELELPKSMKLEYRPSECSTLESLIEEEKSNQKDRLNEIIKQYDTDKLQEEVRDIKQKASELTIQLSMLQQDSNAKVNDLKSTFDKKESELQITIQENEKTINCLKQQIEELKKNVPQKSDETSSLEIGCQTCLFPHYTEYF